ncbi:uncharacterized protein TrAtP1_003354 [Trichoderma atroviride]|uniref:uncharacterized protein n=1 Tax=Hypocrea atroviridis TaxID=63577 RepID=UPI0033314713|nr:hypothetical protein TrAtP1_003354 [Trichoderma atroviride]
MSSKERREAMTKECLMVVYGDGHVGFEHLSEEHLLMHGQHPNDWTIVAMVEFHAAKKEHRNLHIEIEQNRKDAAAQEFDEISGHGHVRFQPSGKIHTKLQPSPASASASSTPGTTRSPPPRSARLAPAPPNRRRYQKTSNDWSAHIAGKPLETLARIPPPL